MYIDKQGKKFVRILSYSNFRSAMIRKYGTNWEDFVVGTYGIEQLNYLKGEKR